MKASRQIVFIVFKNGIIPLAPIEGTSCPSILALRLKILIPRHILQKLLIPFPLVKAGNTSKNFLKEI